MDLRISETFKTPDQRALENPFGGPGRNDELRRERICSGIANCLTQSAGEKANPMLWERVILAALSTLSRFLEAVDCLE